MATTCAAEPSTAHSPIMREVRDRAAEAHPFAGPVVLSLVLALIEFAEESAPTLPKS